MLLRGVNGSIIHFAASLFFRDASNAAATWKTSVIAFLNIVKL